MRQVGFLLMNGSVRDYSRHLYCFNCVREFRFAPFEAESPECCWTAARGLGAKSPTPYKGERQKVAILFLFINNNANV
jgi:hypothetical protein